jgi:polyhydroxyalkanoate synthesis regulator phasin
MDERADGDRGLAELLFLATLGAVSVGAERAERLVDELAERGGVRRDETREAVGVLGRRWRGDAVRLTERASAGLEGLFRDLGLVTREEFDDLELRVAQLEHRLRLLEPPTRPVDIRRRV